MLLSLLDDRRQVSAPTVFHEDIQHTRIAVNVTVVVLHDVCVVEVLQDVAIGESG
jgi:hypothetical protein